MSSHLPAPDDTAATAYCASCDIHHSIQYGDSIQAALNLFRLLEESGRVDFHTPQDQADPRLSLTPLFSEARGHMFGVMTAVDENGHEHVFKAFSGQLNSVWLVPGWVPPVMDVPTYNAVNDPVEKQVKAMTRELEAMAEADPDHKRDPVYKELHATRLGMCRKLGHDLHELCILHNFHGERQRMSQVYLGGGNMPTGTGNCCAPKLLNHAATHGLRPTGIAEFFFGRGSRSGTRQHGHFYPACSHRCARILGFMLCGM